MRYFLELAYNGKEYHGWQKQPNAVSVQEVVEKALCTLLQEEIEIVGAGRTDAGVHARQLFAHCDITTVQEEELVYKLNSLLPRDIVVNGLYRMKPEAHARFDAMSRSYEYHLIQQKDPFAFDMAYLVKRELDLRLMNKAAEILLEYEDFKCFSRSRTDVKSYKCKITSAFWEHKNNRLIFYITADRFLRNMVRAILGTLLDVGIGKTEVEKLHDIIESKNRSEAGASAPAHGLYLTQIEYPNKIFN